jgi:hypothetical protein
MVSYVVPLDLKTDSCITAQRKRKRTVICVTILTDALLRFVNKYPSLTKKIAMLISRD